MEKQTYEILHDSERAHWWFAGRRALLDTFIGEFIGKEKERNLILDAGCSTGSNLSCLKRYGRVCGVDFYEDALRLCRRHDSPALIQADARSLPFLPESYDLIVALDLLEHLDDDAKALKQFNYVLKNNGYLIITIPAYKFLWSNFDVLSKHFKRYSLKELRQRIKEEGFEIKKISYFNCFLFFGVLINRLAKKLFRQPVNLSSDLAPPAEIINKALKMIFLCEVSLIKKINLPFGSSIFCIAQKQAYERKR